MISSRPREWLIANKYTSTPKARDQWRQQRRLARRRRMTQRPDLLGAALPGVGVMDMLRFHKFTIGWAWTRLRLAPRMPDDLRRS